MDICGYEFLGPYTNTSQLKDIPGVYVIVCITANSSDYTPIDCGESEQVKTRIENHDRSDCWKRNCNATVGVFVLYTSGSAEGRLAIERKIRETYNFPCGTR